MDADNDPWVDIAIRYSLEEKLAKYPKFVFFGEMVGQVKKFRYNCPIINGELYSKVYFFDIYDLSTSRYLDYDDMLKTLNELGLESTPELYRGPWLGKELMYPYAEGLTTLGDKTIREGWVLKPIVNRFEYALQSRLILKYVGEGYNLQK